MKTRTLIAAVATLGIVLGSGSAAFAWQHGGGHNGGRGMGYGGGYDCPYYGNSGNGGQALTAEKQAAIDTILRDSDKRLQPLMDQYNAKRLELDALSGNTNAKPEAISKLAGEIATLQGQIRTEMTSRNDKIVAEGGAARGMRGAGMGRHYGGGRGHGGHGGNCW